MRGTFDTLNFDLSHDNGRYRLLETLFSQSRLFRMLIASRNMYKRGIYRSHYCIHKLLSRTFVLDKDKMLKRWRSRDVIRFARGFLLSCERSCALTRAAHFRARFRVFSTVLFIRVRARARCTFVPPYFQMHIISPRWARRDKREEHCDYLRYHRLYSSWRVSMHVWYLTREIRSKIGNINIWFMEHE